ncbi:7-cyano-7-deazaguanine synthase [Elizabethkingia bruuniana]|uniref:7-cyano-7-deazaguanine synthase n=1 Tax=Elizabethkingia bruuniana TaxID=1756149 RepID=A0A7T7UYN3_9FLAO|nr:7-cyano-7-deazaguanine synthase [Elizabethkingia bruuniana]KGO11562.1 ExsB family protein [Elizabethkingia miricola]AQX87370.1 7-cyano-7-deazaguanine synthase [Elizabethkingia bruuniana]KUY29252.1 7-cyano-7-deazaguanine synthase [Elizabethkingia bruuniana]OPB70940.1 7-cyano-7-deazaguanine synthase [Elizabethkingia bruuniana]QDZ62460.1 7-cyano-7-deazaguanine synthase [Elizabethkingia bruuniana]
MKQAVLLSGGIDSICLTYGIKPDIAYTIDYGQRVAGREIYVSKYICQKLGIEHKIIHINCSSLGTGSLAGTENINIAPSEEWWPYRNQLLITFASMQAIKDKVSSLFLASVKSDNFHKDGTSIFYQLIHNLVSYQEGSINIYCPTLEYYSHELVTKYNVPIDLLTIAHSCHISNLACGKCSGCLKQLKVRYEIGIE